MTRGDGATAFSGPIKIYSPHAFNPRSDRKPSRRTCHRRDAAAIVATDAWTKNTRKTGGKSQALFNTAPRDLPAFLRDNEKGQKGPVPQWVLPRILKRPKAGCRYAWGRWFDSMRRSMRFFASSSGPTPWPRGFYARCVRRTTRHAPDGARPTATTMNSVSAAAAP